MKLWGISRNNAAPMDDDQDSYGKGEDLMGAARPYLSQGGIDR